MDVPAVVGSCEAVGTGLKDKQYPGWSLFLSMLLVVGGVATGLTCFESWMDGYAPRGQKQKRGHQAERHADVERDDQISRGG